MTHGKSPRPLASTIAARFRNAVRVGVPAEACARARARSRASSRSCCEAHSTGSPRLRRSVIRAGCRCAATMRSRSRAGRRRSSSTISSRSIPRWRTCIVCFMRRSDHRPRRRYALPRALAFRRPGRARERLRKTRRNLYRLAQPRAHGSRPERPRRSQGRQGFRGRAGHAAGRARAGAGVVVGAAASAAGKR